MVLKSEYLNFYLEYEKYFVEDLGFKPLRQAPDIILRRKRIDLDKELPKYRQKSFWLTEKDITTLNFSTTAN